MKVLKRSFVCCMILTLFCFTGCSNNAQHIENSSAKLSSTTKAQADATNNQLELAISYINKAFDTDVSQLIPEVTSSDNGLTDYVFYLDEKPSAHQYFISFHEDYQYPTTLYYYNNPNTNNIDIANEDIELNDELIVIAKNFIKNIYAVDCSEAKSTAYRYQNKISILLEKDDQNFFDVRFFYQSDIPVGIIYSTNRDDANYTINHFNATKFNT